MDTRFLSFPDFHNVYFYRSITLTILLAIGAMLLFKAADMQLPELLLVGGCLLLMGWRFALEWRRMNKAGPASIHDDELIIASASNHRQIPLSSVRSVASKHRLFMVRRYRSWSEHLAFVEFTLHNGERVYTLAESAVFESPAAKRSLVAIQAAVLAAKVKSAAADNPAALAR
ncbi:hypothetical protein BVH03_16250 [Pseudomonas sp. PA15(2017)]|uniref:hypothetical protein n=1 Tax=Pseudomonas sp. PA15(2017) TaxID=1932111 RepID=UPI0009633595|nr:hypothetical protein [Pseudomonas sp. PA15(2017)]OLU26267.1 hypothetical protein BVH03_16250 [Pseudomonas sp. PA15(2017)]